MKTNNNYLIDLLDLKIKNNQKIIEEMRASVREEDDSFFTYECKIINKTEENSFLNDLVTSIMVADDGLIYLKQYLKSYKHNENEYYSIGKISVLKQLIKEYKVAYKRDYKEINTLGIDGMFDNNIFCDVIKQKIEKYNNCNKVTKKKYRHLSAFLNELLIEMQNANDPLKTLNNKIKLYEKYKNTEVIQIYNVKRSKVDVIKEVLKEYNDRVFKEKRCK